MFLNPDARPARALAVAVLAEHFRAIRRIFIPMAAGSDPRREALKAMIKFLLWCILLVLCWPLALVALVLYPLVWLVLLPFRVVGIAVGGALELVSAVIFLPVRMIRAI